MDRNTTISVVMPVFNEAAGVNAAIRDVRRIAGDDPVEVIVADGGPGQATLAAIEDRETVRVDCPPGRGVQMNAGAAVASGDVLLFLHADTRLPDNAFDAVRRALSGEVRAGAFKLDIDSPRPIFRVIAWFANRRTAVERIPYGDQAQFLTTELFRELGGFAEIPIMEDVELFQRIRLMALPIILLEDTVTTSARRWEEEGVLRRTLNNWLLRVRYRFGAPPERLARGYRPPAPKESR